MLRRKLLCGVLVMLALLFGGEAYAAENKSDENTGSGGSYGHVETHIVRENPDFDVECDYGIDGYAEYSTGSVISLSITDSKNFTGKVSVTPYDSDSWYGQRYLSYAKEVSLAAGQTSRLDFYVSNMQSGTVRVRIYDEDGDVVYSENDTLTIRSSGQSVVVGALSDDVTALGYIGNAGVTDASSQSLSVELLDMSEDTFPADAAGLAVLDYILIDSYDTAKLSDEQYEAMKAWVKSGGTLVLALGADAANVMHIFDDGFVSGELLDTAGGKVSFVTSQGETAAYRDVQMTGFTLEGGSALRISSEGLESTVSIGTGHVVVLQYSLALEPISGSDEGSTVAENILNATSWSWKSDTSDYSDNKYQYGINAATASNGRKRVSAAGIIICLLIYIILAGPVTYIVLKVMKKRELMWVLVPAWAVLGTLLIYIASLRISVRKPICLSFTAADISDSQTVNEDIYMSVIGAKADEYQLSMDERGGGLALSDTYYSYSYNQEAEESAIEKLESGDEVKVGFTTTSPFESVEFVSNAMSENDIGGIARDISVYTDGLEGSITNNTSYDIKDLVVMASNGYYYCADSIAAGQTIDISGSECYMTRSSGYSYSSSYLYGPLSAYYQTKYGTDDYSSFTSSVRYNEDEYMAERLNEESNQNGQAVLAVWGRIDRFDDIFEENDSDDYGTCLVYTMDNVQYADASSYYSNLYDIAQGDTDMYDADELYMYSSEVNLSFQFGPDTNISELYLAENSNGNSSQAAVATSATAMVYALNSKTGSYDVIYSGGDVTLSQADLQPYVNSANGYLLTLKFGSVESGSSDYATNNYLPLMSAKGGE